MACQLIESHYSEKISSPINVYHRPTASIVNSSAAAAVESSSVSAFMKSASSKAILPSVRTTVEDRLIAGCSSHCSSNSSSPSSSPTIFGLPFHPPNYQIQLTRKLSSNTKPTSLSTSKLSLNSVTSSLPKMPGGGREHGIWFLRNGPPPISKQNVYQHVLTVVFDLDETLVYSRKDGMVIPRPQLSQLLQLLSDFNANAKEHYSNPPLVEVIVWTHAMSSYARNVLDIIDPNGTLIQFCICQDETEASSCTFQATAKDLSLLGRNLQHVVIVENCPASVCHNPANAIIVPDFIGDSSADSELKVLSILMDILRDLLQYFQTHCSSHTSFNVPSFLVGCPQLSMHVVPDEKEQNFATLILRCKARSSNPFKASSLCSKK